MNHMSISVALLFLICSVGRTFPMHYAYQACKNWWNQKSIHVNALHNAIPAEVKEEIIKQTLNQSEDVVDATQQLAKFSQLSHEWNGVVIGLVNSNAFKEYEEKGVCIKPYPVFYYVEHDKTGLLLLKNGISSQKGTAKFYYLDPNDITVDAIN